MLSSGAENAGRAPLPGLAFPHSLKSDETLLASPLRSSTRSQIEVRADPTGAPTEASGAKQTGRGSDAWRLPRAGRQRLSLSAHSVSRHRTCGDPPRTTIALIPHSLPKGPSRGDERGDADTRLWPAPDGARPWASAPSGLTSYSSVR